jgi:hypothetical protein
MQRRATDATLKESAAKACGDKERGQTGPGRGIERELVYLCNRRLVSTDIFVLKMKDLLRGVLVRKKCGKARYDSDALLRTRRGRGRGTRCHRAHSPSAGRTTQLRSARVAASPQLNDAHSIIPATQELAEKLMDAAAQPAHPFPHSRKKVVQQPGQGMGNVMWG